LKQLEKKLFSIVALAESVEADVSLSERVGMADFCLLRHLIDFQNNFLLEGFKFSSFFLLFVLRVQFLLDRS